ALSFIVSFLLARPPPCTTLFPYTTLFRSPLRDRGRAAHHGGDVPRHGLAARVVTSRPLPLWLAGTVVAVTFALLLWLEGRRPPRSEEHTSELQSRRELVCRLLLEKKKQRT